MDCRVIKTGGGEGLGTCYVSPNLLPRWQSRVEIEDYSIMYFEHIATYKVLLSFLHSFVFPETRVGYKN